VKEMVNPLLEGLEKTVELKTKKLFDEVQSEIGNKAISGNSILNKDLEQVLEYGFLSLRNVLLNKNLGSDSDYGDAVITITNDTLQPFQLSPIIAKECKKIVEGKTEDFMKAKALFDWFEENISYDEERAKKKDSYRNAKEVFTDKKGICGETAFLYIVMAWFVGIKSASFVNVEVDNSGKDVAHACASFNHYGNTILVDPAYHSFDIKHQKYELWDNEKTVQAFKLWN